MAHADAVTSPGQFRAAARSQDLDECAGHRECRRCGAGGLLLVSVTVPAISVFLARGLGFGDRVLRVRPLAGVEEVDVAALGAELDCWRCRGRSSCRELHRAPSRCRPLYNSGLCSNDSNPSCHRNRQAGSPWGWGSTMGTHSAPDSSAGGAGTAAGAGQNRGNARVMPVRGAYGLVRGLVSDLGRMVTARRASRRVICGVAVATGRF